MNKPKIADRWIMEVVDPHGNKVSRRYFDSETAAHAALATRQKNKRMPRDGNVARVFRAAPLSLVK